MLQLNDNGDEQGDLGERTVCCLKMMERGHSGLRG